MSMRFTLLAGLAAILPTAAASAQFVSQGSFPTGSSLVGGTHDAADGSVWVYSDFGTVIRHFSASGALLGTVPRPGGSANDADVEIAAGPTRVGATTVPAGTLLYIDGESGPAEIYAINPATGTVLATLNTAFGSAHVVGGAYHQYRNTFFLVQDKVPGGTIGNLVGEVDAATGAVISTFRITTVRPSFTVNFGDLDVGGNENLFVVSSDESTVLELTPDGDFVTEHALPVGVTSLCGVGVGPGTCDLWAFSTSGVVTRLNIAPGGPDICTPPCHADVNQDGNTDQGDVDYLITVIAGGLNPTNVDPDFNLDGNADQGDIDALITAIAGGGCP